MWIECHETCTGCGQEVTLATDGRFGYGFTDDNDTDIVWRDGHLLVLMCPTWTIDDEACATEVKFTGEGTGPTSDPYYAKLILPEAP